MTTSKQQSASKARASATVILLRDTPTDVEVLLVQKNHNINFGGSWVFPGGMVEEVDVQQSNVDSIDTARYAACRETKEETSIKLAADDLNPLSRWVTPAELPKRYSTWFFITDVNELKQHVDIDNQEIVDAKWISPQQALALQAEQEIQLNAPSFVSLIGLSRFNNAADAIAFYKDKQAHEYLPRGIKTDNGFIALYQEDCGYTLNAEQALSAKGLKHRTLMHKSQAWEYICEMPFK